MAEETKKKKLSLGKKILLGASIFFGGIILIAIIIAATGNTDNLKDVNNNLKEYISENDNGLKVTYDEAMLSLGDYFDMKSSPLSDGTARYLATHYATQSMLELIGPKEDITKATLIIFFPDGLTESQADSFTDGTSYITGHFLMNLFGDNSKEASKFVQNVVNNKTESSMTIGELSLSVDYSEELEGMTTVVVAKK